MRKLGGSRPVSPSLQDIEYISGTDHGAGASELPQNLMWLDATLDFNINRIYLLSLGFVLIHKIYSYPQDSGKGNIVMEHLAP